MDAAWCFFSRLWGTISHVWGEISRLWDSKVPHTPPHPPLTPSPKVKVIILIVILIGMAIYRLLLKPLVVACAKSLSVLHSQLHGLLGACTRMAELVNQVLETFTSGHSPEDFASTS